MKSCCFNQRIRWVYIDKNDCNSLWAVAIKRYDLWWKVRDATFGEEKCLLEKLLSV